MVTTHDIRERLNMTQEEFAKAFHVPYRTVTTWDNVGMKREYLHYWLEIICDEYEEIAKLKGCFSVASSDE